MPWQKKSAPKAERVVRHKLRDGTIKEYRYGSYKTPPAPRRQDTLSALIDAYKDSPEWRGLSAKTKTVYAIHLRPLDRIGHTDPRTITRREILTIRDAIASNGRNAAATAFVRTTSALFQWGVDREWLDQNPVVRVKSLPGGHLPAWTPENAAIARAKLPDHMRRVVILALYTGQRRGDLCSMRWSAYDGQVIRLTQEKTGAELVIPAHPELKAEMDEWKRSAASTTILVNADGVPWKPNNLSYHMGAALERIGLPPDLNVHGIRKLAAANLADVGCSTKEIGAITGHRTLAMIELYTRSADQQKLASAAIFRLSNIQKPTNLQTRPKKGGKP